MSEVFHCIANVSEATPASSLSISLPRGVIDAIVMGSIKGDVADATSGMVDGEVVMLVASDDPSTRALVSIFKVLRHSSVAAGLAEMKKVDPNFKPLYDISTSREVISFLFARPVYISTDHDFSANQPEQIPGMTHYSTGRLRGSQGSIAIIDVHATPLGPTTDPTEAPFAQTTICSRAFDRNNRQTSRQIFTYNSRPVVAYVSADTLEAEPDTVVTSRGLEVPWKGTKFIASVGKEAIQVTICRLFNHLVVVYERQIAVFAINAVAGEDLLINGITTDLMICSIEITTKILEAASHLLARNGDFAFIGVYTPDTTSVTSNVTSGWFVIETNVSRQTVENAYKASDVPNLVFHTRQDVYAHLRQNWRNFVHLRFQDGTQLVLFNPKMSSAKEIAILPLQQRSVHDGNGQGVSYRGIVLRGCETYGSSYLKKSKMEAARDVIANDTKYAILQDFDETKKVVKNTSRGRPVIFDRSGAMRFDELMEALTTNVHEVNSPVQHIEFDHHLLQTLDEINFETVMNKVKNGQKMGVNGLVLTQGKSGKQIYEGFMERFVRNFITSLYVHYGHQANHADDQSLVHMIYRAGMMVISSRTRTFNLLNEGYEWLMKDVEVMGVATPFSELVGTVNTHVTKASRPGKAPELVKMERKNLLIAYVMNRAYEQFAALDVYLSGAYTRWILSKTQIAAKISPPMRLPGPSVMQTSIPVTVKMLEDIKTGKKTCEVRANVGNVRNIEAGKNVTLVVNDTRNLVVKVLKLERYPSFDAAVTEQNYTMIMPSAQNRKFVLDEYRKRMKNPSDEKTAGVVLLTFETPATVPSKQQRTSRQQFAQPPVQQAQAPMTTAEIISRLNPEEQKTFFGEKIYEKIVNMGDENAPLLTGMLVELEVPELLRLLDSEEAFVRSLNDARDVLSKHK